MITHLGEWGGGSGVEGVGEKERVRDEGVREGIGRRESGRE